MKAGALRARIRIQQRAESSDGQGGTALSWADVCQAWASISGRGGREFQTAKQTRSALTDEIHIRYRPGITAAMRVVTANRVLSIAQPPYDPDGRRRELVLFCEEIQGETPA